MVPMMKAGGDMSSTVQTSGWMTDLTDGLDFGLKTWMQIEQVNAMKDASAVGRKQLDETVQVESPQVVEVVQAPQAPKDLVSEALKGLKIGTGSLMLVFGGIGFLWWLSRK